MSWRLVLVAVVVLASGCVGLIGESPDGTSVRDDTSSPPGIDGGIANATTLVRAHQRSFAGTGVVVETSRARRSTVSGAGNQSTRTRTRASANGTLWQRRTVETIDGEQQAVLWHDGERGVRRFDDTGRTDTVNGPVGPTRRYQTADLRRWLATGEYGVVAVEAGESTRYVLSATTYTPPDGDPLEADTVRYDARAVITESGRVTGFAATLSTVERNKWGRQAWTASYTYRVVRTGSVAVPRPEWTGDVPPEVRDG
ncbi:hypothetical protein [Haloarcula marina]|uniref:hypothetical protein n=1 Tax=Haloarcula marina TaxID=2961574 RepID=UPI0020B68769|nr:hypothetical protein [Halomicroarcula marina]